jgi:phosphoglycolate phosphatase-like HAD superfamily hydrolase
VIDKNIKHLIFDFDGVLADSFNFDLNKYNKLYDIGLTAKELQVINGDSHHLFFL